MERKTKIIVLKSKRVTNPSFQPLTLEKLKTFKGMENLSDGELQQTLLEIKVLSTIMIDRLKNQGSDNSENNFNLNDAA